MLGEFGGKALDVFEERLVRGCLEAMGKEDETAGLSDGNEKPGVNGEAEDGGVGGGGTVGGERGFDGELEGTDGSGRARDHVGKVGEGDREPGGDAVDRKADEGDGGDVDHALAEPD